MQGIFDNLSKISQNVLRKLIYNNLKHAFHESDVQFEKLCNLLYADTISHAQCKQAFKDVIDTLECIEHFLSKYTQQQMEVIGVDKDCDIKFIENKLEQYKLKTTDLKGGIAERIRHESYFIPNKTERHLILPLYKEFLSLTHEVENMLNILSEGYDKLFECIYSNDSELVLNRFNNHFKNVANHISKISGDAIELFESADGLSSSGEILLAKKQTKIDESFLRSSFQNCYAADVIVERVIEKYDKPLELAQTFVEYQISNSEIDKYFANVVKCKYIYDKQMGVENLPHRARGRPPEDFCYNDCIEAIGGILLRTCPMKTEKALTQTEREEQFNCSIAMFVVVASFFDDRLFGKIASYYRFLIKLGFSPPYSLRYFQQKISEFRQYLREKKKGGFKNLFDGGFTKQWKSKIRRFAPLEKIQNIIIEKFMQLQLA